MSCKAASDSFQADVLFLNIPPGRKRPDVEAHFGAQMEAVIKELHYGAIEFVVFASSTSVYGDMKGVVVEADAGKPRAGLMAGSGARTGVVTLIQRFGSALNLNVHLHMLILDGVYTLEQNGPRFHRVGAPDMQTLERLPNRLVRRIVRRPTRDGLLVEDPEQPWLDLEPSDTLDQLNAASIRYRIAVGQGAGGRTLTLKDPTLARTDSAPKPFTVDRDGFSLNAAVSCQAHQRDRLERLCRYITRPALCLERISTNAAGQVGSSLCELPFDPPDAAILHGRAWPGLKLQGPILTKHIRHVRLRPLAEQANAAQAPGSKKVVRRSACRSRLVHPSQTHPIQLAHTRRYSYSHTAPYWHTGIREAMTS